MNNETVIEKSNSGNITYYINEWKGTVVAKLRVDREWIFMMVLKCIKTSRFDCKKTEICDYLFDSIIEDVFDMELKSIKIKNEFVGKARCSGIDKFDVEIGKQLALQRAKRKCNSYALNKMCELSNIFDSITAGFNRQWGKEAKKLLQCSYEIGKICNTKENKNE